MSQIFLQSMLLGIGVMMAVLASRHALHRRSGLRIRALPARQELKCVQPLRAERHR